MGDRLYSALAARAYFLLLRQKKVAKEKATPGSAPLRGSLRYSPGRAACQNSPAAQTRQADYPRPACVAQRLSRGPKKLLGSSNSRKNDLLRSTAQKGQKSNSPHPLSQPARLAPPPDKGEAGRGFGFPGHLRGAEQRRRAGGSRRALFEGRSPELRSRALSDAAHREEVLLGCPAFRVAQGTGAAGTDPGVAFSLATFFWPHKKSTPASKAETHANQYSKREQHKEPSKC